MLTGKDLGDALQEAMRRKGVSQAVVARYFGVKAPSVSDWIKFGRIDKRHLERLFDFFSDVCDMAFWGLTGPLGGVVAPNVDQERTAYNASSDRYVYVPVYNVRGSMGNGSAYHHEEIEGKHSYSQAWLLEEALDVKNLVRMKGEGDSMLPTIADGDTLLINLAEKKIGGRVYAFRVGDEIRVKRLFRQLDGRVRVVSDNPDKNLYPDEYLSIDDQPEVIGRVRDRSGKNGL
ncbi:MAG: helix-turn-helix transcriptional regulator [Rhodocyclaceae bacterium]|nr:helix-turn-helix transcriptional regulator [Rhodocyclaceae bacterium]